MHPILKSSDIKVKIAAPTLGVDTALLGLGLLSVVSFVVLIMGRIMSGM